MRKSLILSVAAGLLTLGSYSLALANDASQKKTLPSEASVQALLQVMQTRNALDDSLGRMHAFVDRVIRKRSGGLPLSNPHSRPLSPEDEKRAAQMRSKVTAVFSESMTWDSLKPLYLSAYRELYSQQEIDGMMAFYQSKSGQAVIAKQPQVLEKTTQLVRYGHQEFGQQVQQLVLETARKLRAASNSKN